MQFLFYLLEHGENFLNIRLQQYIKELYFNMCILPFKPNAISNNYS